MVDTELFRAEKLELAKQIRGALARGYVHDKNRSKEFDSDLLLAQEEEILNLLKNQQELEEIEVMRDTPEDMRQRAKRIIDYADRLENGQA
jgi:hypothetical protein